MRKLRFSSLLLVMLVVLSLVIGGSCFRQIHVNAKQQRAIERSAGIVVYGDLSTTPKWYSKISSYIDLSFLPIWAEKQASLRIDGEIDEAKLEFLGDLPNVTKLFIDDSNISDATLNRMNQWTTVQTLEIGHCPNISNDGLANFSRFPLQTVWINNVPITQTGFRYLDLSHVSRMSVDHQVVTGTAVKAWPPLTSLHDLRVAGEPVTPLTKDWRFLRCCSEVRKLTVDVPVHERALEHLASMSNLEELTISYGVSDRHISRIGGCRRLTELVLSGDFTGDSIGNLSNCPLRSVSLVSTHLRDSALAELAKMTTIGHLYLDSPCLTGRGFEHLRNSTTITYMDILNAAVDDEDVDLFLSLPKLRTLRLVKTKITEHGRDRIKAANPRLRLDWSSRQAESEN